jgi:putative ABC transport system ATP-binding protein
MTSGQSFLSRLSLLKNWFAEPKPNTPNRTPTIICPKSPTLVGRDLLRTFGSGDSKTYALRDASIELHPGNLNLLMGPSGSGKSTLLAVISALLRPEGGSVMAAGHDMWKLNDREMEDFRLKHCSYIFQGYNLFPSYTARQQLEVVLEWGEGVSRREARKRADHVLGQLGLTSRADLRPAALSGGEKQRVAIARALVKNPTFIFADEPTSALDWDNGQQVMNLLKECAKVRNATVLVVTHDHRLESYADHIFKMADGRMLPNKAPSAKRQPDSHKPASSGKDRVRIGNLEFANA